MRYTPAHVVADSFSEHGLAYCGFPDRSSERSYMPRLTPLPVGSVPELNDVFDQYARAGQFIPNSQLILQRKPKLVRALRALGNAVFDPEGEVSIGLKRLLAYVVARTHGCHY